MIVERHYDDEALIELLGGEGSSSTGRDPHLAICRGCSDTLSSLRSVADVLGDHRVWDLRDLPQEGVPSTIASLRSFATAMAADESQAGVLVKDLLGKIRSSWLPIVEREARFRTEAVARRLIERSEVVIDNQPADAAAMARAAVEIASGLQSAQLRGAAWRQYAYAVFYTGDFKTAVEAVENAQAALETCPVADYELARLAIVRSVVYTSLERFDEAVEASRWSARVFRAYGDRERVASALSAEAYARIDALRYRDALPILLEIEHGYRSDVGSDTYARVLANLGLCYWQTGQVSEGLKTYRLAASLYDESNSAAEAARVRLNIAALLAAEGMHSEAKDRLRAVREEFKTLGMQYTAVSADLFLAELLLVEGNFAEVEEICHDGIRQLQAAGLAHTAEGLMALTYLKEAAAGRRATAADVRKVRSYVERLPEQPRFLFAAPPFPPE